ncbi:MAG: acetate/propionate family kinase [Christensenellaceae bacterium]|nr:acetate/propionate family kinase [Christensenellaceae bacterium]
MKVLICNAGSTSLKFKLYLMPEETVLAGGNIERIRDEKGGLFRYYSADGFKEETHAVVKDYRAGIDMFLEKLCGSEHRAVEDTSEIDAVGFKTVLSKDHYGVHLMDDETIQGMRDFLSVAPAHNSHYLEAVGSFKEILPETPMVGAFETAFHQTMPKEAYIYSGPYEWYEKYGIRRLGYHGASHSYVADCLTVELGSRYRAVSCHLGGSGSLCAIVDGKSTDTSFGMSLQCGLPQSNRAGDIDPFIISYLMRDCGMTEKEVFDGLGKNGGLLGISGVSNDLRDIEEAADTNERAKLAIDIYIREIIRYIGGYAAIMGGLDAIALTGGIGENSLTVRNRIAEAFSYLGLKPGDEKPMKEGRHGSPGKIITSGDSAVKMFVIPANEELGIARKVYDKLK